MSAASVLPRGAERARRWAAFGEPECCGRMRARSMRCAADLRHDALPPERECRSIDAMSRSAETDPHSATPTRRLLADDEPGPFRVEREHGASAFMLICDHAGRRIPRALGDLGLDESERSRHIAWDIGADGLASHLSARLDATLIAQTYSRLVIDCNRPLDSPTSITTRSERTDIPGNVGLSREDAEARAREIFAPYHARIVDELDRRKAASRPTVLVSVHSFTPVFHEIARPWHLGMLYNRDTRVAHALLGLIRDEVRWTVGDNE